MAEREVLRKDGVTGMGTAIGVGIGTPNVRGEDENELQFLAGLIESA